MQGILDNHLIKNLSTLARPRLLFLLTGVFGAVIAGGVYSADAVIFGTKVRSTKLTRAMVSLKQAPQEILPVSSSLFWLY